MVIMNHSTQEGFAERVPVNQQDLDAFSLALLEGVDRSGLQRFPNPNGQMMEAAAGCALIDETVRNGKRHEATGN
jgi:hypothetical protein